MLPCFIRKLDELLKPPDMVAFFVNQLFLKLLTKKNRLSQIFHKFQFFKVELKVFSNKNKSKWINIF